MGENGGWVSAPIGVLVIVALTLSALVVHKKEQDVEATHQKARQIYMRTLDSAPIGSRTDRAVTAPQAYREEWRSERDLDAQLAMAYWARWVTWATAGGVVVGLGSLALLWLAVFHARAAAIAADNGARAAQQTVLETRRIGEAQIRAYLGVLKPELTVRADRPIFSVAFRNTGNSPAMALRASARLVFDPMSLDGSAECRPIDFIIGALSSGEQSKQIDYAFDVRLRDHPSGLRSVTALRVWMSIEWLNVFDKQDSVVISYLAKIENLDGGRRIKLMPEAFVPMIGQG